MSGTIDAAPAPQAWRIRTGEPSAEGWTLVGERSFPERRSFSGQSLSVEEALALDDTSDLVVFVMPAGAATPYETLLRAEAHVRADRSRAMPPMELALRARFVLSGRRALAVTQDPPQEAIATIVHFAALSEEIGVIEDELARLWPRRKILARLTRSVGAFDLRHQRDVDRDTEAVAALRAACYEADYRLALTDPALPPVARRHMAELSLAAEFQTRLNALEDMLELLVESCETANERLTEYSYFNWERWLEILVVAALTLDLVFQWRRP